MLPSTVKFASRMKKMGVGDGMRIVVYDADGLYSAARAWWTFRVMGHDDVAVLNGGLKKWTSENGLLKTALRHAAQSVTTPPASMPISSAILTICVHCCAIRQNKS